MKDHGLTLGLEQKQRVAAVHKKPTAHQKGQTGSTRPVTFWLYGIGQYEHQSSHFDLYGVGRG